MTLGGSLNRWSECPELVAPIQRPLQPPSRCWSRPVCDRDCVGSELGREQNRRIPWSLFFPASMHRILAISSHLRLPFLQVLWLGACCRLVCRTPWCEKYLSRQTANRTTVVDRRVQEKPFSAPPLPSGRAGIFLSLGEKPLCEGFLR